MSDSSSAGTHHSDSDDLHQRHLQKLEGAGDHSNSRPTYPGILLHRCRNCGATEMLPSGACHVCLICGETTGCS